MLLNGRLRVTVQTDENFGENRAISILRFVRIGRISSVGPLSAMFGEYDESFPEK